MKKLIRGGRAQRRGRPHARGVWRRPRRQSSTPGAQSTASESAGPSVEPIDFKACIVSDAGGFDDKSFNQLSYEGTKEATDELGAAFAEVQSDSAADFRGNLAEPRVRELRQPSSRSASRCPPTRSRRPSRTRTSTTSSSTTPRTTTSTAPRTRRTSSRCCTTRRRPRSSRATCRRATREAGKVGTFGGQPYPTVTIFMDGFKQGVDYYNKVKGTSVQVVGYEGGDKGSFTGGFEANDSGQGGRGRHHRPGCRRDPAGRWPDLPVRDGRDRRLRP